MSTAVTPRPRLVTSPNGLAFVEREEGRRCQMYDDTAGNCTIGVGHLVHIGKTGTNPTAEEPYQNGITPQQIDQLLAHDLSICESAINDYVTVQLSQNQFDALVDFTFEMGAARLLHSTLLAMLNAGSYGGVPAQLERWIYENGSPSNALLARRQREAALWNA